MFDLNKVSTDDSGRYTCVAKNRQKEVKADVFLIVNGEFGSSKSLF